MGLKKSLFCFLILVLMPTIATGCDAPELNAIELIPTNANMIVGIQVSRILNDEDLIDAYNEAETKAEQPQTIDEALDEVVQAIGIDPRDISEAVMFVDMTSIGEADYLGIFVEGTFDEKHLPSDIEEEMAMDFIVSEYKGYELYVDQNEEFAITFLSDEMVLLGTARAVKDAIDVSKGVREKVSGVVLDTYNRFGDALIKLAFEVSGDIRRQIAEEPPDEMPISLESFADIETIGFAVNKQMEMVTVQIDSHFLSVESAEDAKDTLSGAISFFKGASPDQRLKELLGKIKVNVVESWVTIDFAMTVPEIVELVEAYQP